MVAKYDDLLEFVKAVLPEMRITRLRNLALTILGILQVRDAHLTVSEIARAVPGPSDHWHKFKRIWRFLSNVKWAPADQFDAMLQFLLSRFRVGPLLPVIIDQSTIGGKWEVLWASIPFRGRALPVRFLVFRYEDIRNLREMSQNRIEEQFIRDVVGMIPSSLTPLILLDRGYARVAMIDLLESLRVRYVIRARADTWVRHGQYSGPMRGIPVGRGAVVWWSQALVYQREPRGVNLAVTLNASAEEPWYLLTNLRRCATTVNWYERRFRCEEEFRDIKDQLHLETLRVRTNARVERLLFALALSYVALTLIGLAVRCAGLTPKVCRYAVSAAWVALRALKMPQILKPRMIRRALLVRRWALFYESG